MHDRFLILERMCTLLSFISRHTNSNVIINSVFSERSAALLDM